MMSEVFLSVIVPTRNNGTILRRCLAALFAAARPSRGFEVLIVDNSDAGHGVRLSPEHQATDFPARVIPTEPRGLMAARHVGANAARGQVLCFIDDDTLVNSRWLVALEERFSDDSVVLAGGPIMPLYEGAVPTWVEGMWKTCSEGRYMSHLSLLDFGSRERLIDPEWIWGCNYAVRRTTFMDLRGTLPDYMPGGMMLLCGIGESGLSIKIRHSGSQAWYSPALGVEHCMAANRLNENYFVTREFIFGIEQSYTELRREAGAGPTQGVPARPFPSLSRWLGGALRRVVRRPLIPVAAPLALDARATRFSRAFDRGLAIHREAAGRSSLLREWVAREDYFGERSQVTAGSEVDALQATYRDTLEQLLSRENSS